jgi:xanthine dehydrogenase molybdopterin-binding subunit B
MSLIENEEILKSPEHGKKIKSALNRIEKAFKEITDLDYTIYISAHGSINVMNTDDVPFKNNLDYHDEQVVAHGSAEKLDCGDW